MLGLFLFRAVLYPYHTHRPRFHSGKTCFVTYSVREVILSMLIYYLTLIYLRQRNVHPAKSKQINCGSGVFTGVLIGAVVAAVVGIAVLRFRPVAIGEDVTDDEIEDVSIPGLA